MEERPEVLLKSALEKIVYFEARSEQLGNDLANAQKEADRLRQEMGQASQREIELRRLVAELEVRVSRAHSEREDASRVADALRRERADLIGKMLDASRIQAAGEAPTREAIDLAGFIAELRGEVLEGRNKKTELQANAQAAVAEVVAAAETKTATERDVVTFAQALHTQGRLEVSLAQVGALVSGASFDGRTEETLFGFSVRELSAPDAPARLRAAERLKALGHPAAAPALAAALNAETEPEVLAALLVSFAAFARGEGVNIVLPHLASPHADVRIAALKALLAIDPVRAGAHLTAAVKDPDKSVRRRASLLALSLTGGAALELGQEAIRDADAEVRALAALVLGASGAELARPLLLAAMRDPDLKVRRTAARSVSKMLGVEVGHVADMEDAVRRREVRKLASLPVRVVEVEKLRAELATRLDPKVYAAAAPAPVAVHAGAVVQVARPERVQRAEGSAHGAAAAPQRSRVAVLEVDAAPAQPQADESLCNRVLGELRVSIRGRTLDDLAASTGTSVESALFVCKVLEGRGQAVRRGLKYFVA
jgi:HEAT repeats